LVDVAAASEIHSEHFVIADTQNVLQLTVNVQLGRALQQCAELHSWLTGGTKFQSTQFAGLSLSASRNTKRPETGNLCTCRPLDMFQPLLPRASEVSGTGMGRTLNGKMGSVGHGERTKDP
jgi:hypothetical protein